MMKQLRIIVILSVLLLVACVPKSDEERNQWRSYKKSGYLQILWQDGTEQTYKGQFRDYPEKIELIKGVYINGLDTVYTYWSNDSILTDTGYAYIDYVEPKYIYALPTNFIKAQIKQYYITNEVPPEFSN